MPDWRKDEAFVAWLNSRRDSEGIRLRSLMTKKHIKAEMKLRQFHRTWLAGIDHENERCARVCEKDADTYWHGDECAAAIRSLLQTPTEDPHD